MYIAFIEIDGALLDFLNFGFFVDDHATVLLASTGGVGVCVSMAVKGRKQLVKAVHFL